MHGQSPPVSVRLLGPLEVAVAGHAIAVDTRKALAIVALVATEGRPFARDELAAMFWPEADEEAARGSLRRTLSSLRAAVGRSGLIVDRARVALHPETTIDLADLQRLAPSRDRADLERASTLARGPFMAGFALRDSPAFDEWQAIWTARIERMVASLLDRLADARLAADDAPGALEAARRRVDLDPLDEAGQRRLIDLLARTGDRAGAIRQYRELVALFDRELGVGPLRETTDLYDGLREGRLPGPGPTAGSVGAADAAQGKRTAVAPVPSPFVGREGEMTLVESAWRAAGTDGRVVVIEGEAGIGKTRLGEAVAGLVRTRGGIVLAARGYPGEGAIAYGPIAELLRAGLALESGPGRLEALDETARLEIGRLVDLPSPLRVPGSAVPFGAGTRVRLLDAVASALCLLVAGPAPGLLWVDDLHLADASTREALAYLARRLQGRPVLMLLAWRREDLDGSGAAMADDVARLPAATSLVLARLGREQVATIVRAARIDGGVDDATIDAIASESEGLPLHVVAAVAGDDPAGSGLRHGVQALIRDRLASVGGMAGQVLSAAAVIGRSFDLATVRHASGRSEEETVEAIEELVRRGLVREVPGGVGASITYDFAHGRIRDVAYESMSLARRRLLHRRTAEALRLEPSVFGRDERARFARIAGHEQQAGRAAEAAQAHLAAANQAEAVFANREAIDHLESAVALGLAAPGATHARIGELHARLGEYPAAVGSLETAAALVDASDLPAIETALGRVHRRRGDLPAALSHLAAALGSPHLSDPIRARALTERSVVDLRLGDLDGARAAAAGARELAAKLGDAHLAGVAERLVGLVAQARGDLGEARDALEHSVRLALDDPDPTSLIAAATGLAITLAADGDVDPAVRSAERAIEACRRIGDRHLEAAVENHLADILHGAGRQEDSMAHLKRAVALFAEVGETPDPGIWSLAAW